MLILALLARSAQAQPAPVIRTTLDAAGNVGTHSAIAIGSDGLGLVAYRDETNGDLKVAHCTDIECTTATITTLDSADDVGEFPSVIVGDDGLGLIAYYDRTVGDLKTAHCADLPCTSATLRTVDSFGNVGAFARMVKGSDGRALIGYNVTPPSPFDPYTVKVAHCLDADCSSATVTAIPGPGTSIDWMVGTDGLGLAVYASADAFGPLVRAIHCSNLDCSSSTITTIAPALGSEGMGASIVRGANGLGFVSIARFEFPQPLVSYAAGPCADIACTSVAFAPVFIGGRLWAGSDGLPLITAALPVVYDCLDAGCTSLRSNRFDYVGQRPSLAIGADSRPLLSYHDDAQQDLKVAHCTNADCFMTGADVAAGLGYATPVSLVTGTPTLVPGQDVRLYATAGNRGPDAEPDALVRMNIPARLLVQQVIPGPPTCVVAAGQLECHAPAPYPAGFTAEVRTLVDQGPAEILNITATAIGTLFDLDPTNQQAGGPFAVKASCSIGDATVVEGDAGQSEAVFTVRRHPSLASVQESFFFQTGDQSATAGTDYVASSGFLTFGAGLETSEIRVPVLGDTAAEPNERFLVTISIPPSSCGMLVSGAYADIVDDDAASLSTRELSHGSGGWYAAAPPTRGVPPLTDLYRMRQEPFASYEVVLDGASGDMTPIAIERVAADNATVLQTALSFGTTASLRWINSTGVTVDNQHLHVVGAGCGAGCGPEDLYRIRAYETTASIPRFNNAGGQISVLVLQNTSADTVAGQARFWTPAGTILATRAISLAPMSTLVLNTTTVPGLPGNGGTVTITHDGRYGALAGKVIALEPATGFSFDSPLGYRPR